MTNNELIARLTKAEFDPSNVEQMIELRNALSSHLTVINPPVAETGKPVAMIPGTFVGVKWRDGNTYLLLFVKKAITKCHATYYYEGRYGEVWNFPPSLITCAMSPADSDAATSESLEAWCLANNVLADSYDRTILGLKAMHNGVKNGVYFSEAEALGE